MNVTIRKIGNSEGIIIPKEMLDGLGVKAGDAMQLRAENGRLTMEPVAEDISEDLEAARHFMEKYKNALKKLAE
ncbi:AbrB/MazE/SpoVT family DNA-binding domain-containing protein [Rhizobium sp. SIMBA_035]